MGDDDAGDSGVQDYLSVIESPAMDSKKTELITAMLRSETRPYVLKVFSERAMWRGQGEKGYFHGAPEDWNCVAAALRSEALSALVAPSAATGQEAKRQKKRNPKPPPTKDPALWPRCVRDACPRLFECASGQRRALQCSMRALRPRVKQQL